MSDTFRFRISFSQSWILSKRGSSVLPPEEILQELEKMFTVTDSSSKISECIGIIKGSEHDKKEVIQIIAETITKTYGISEKDDVYKIDISEHSNDKTEFSHKDDEREKANEPITTPNHKLDIKAKAIDELVGANNFKALAHECQKVAQRLIENGLLDSFTSRSYVVSINDGYGLTTYLNTFADLIEELSLFKFTSSTKVVEITLDHSNVRNNDKVFSAVLSYFQGANTP